MAFKIKKSLRSKLVRTMLVTLALVGIISLAFVAWMQYRTAQDNLLIIEGHIRDSIVEKGNVLTENHALALRGLVADNAFSDVNNLVGRTVTKDEDVLYGLFLSAENTPWVYVSPNKPKPDEGDNEMWVELKVPTQPATGTGAMNRTVDLFGHEVFEVAMAVVAEEELLGTIRYGLSLKRMRTALDAAHDKSFRALVQTLIFLGVVIVVTLLLGLLLVSRAASRITRPLGDLTSAASSLAAGDRNVSVNIKSQDEIELLGATFNQMVADLKQSYESLEDLNRNLEQKVEQRTRALSERNRDMRLVLDNVDQGFITVFRDGIMALEHSSVVDVWLGSYGENTRFVDFLAGSNGEFAEWFDLGWDELLAETLPLDLCLDQLPKHMQVKERELSFSYSPIFDDDGALQSVLVVIADVTELLEFERKEAEQREVLNVFKRVMLDRRGYMSFHSEADAMVEKVSTGQLEDDLVALRRTIHTLKGNTALFGLNTVAAICHEMEDSVDETGQAPTAEQRKELVVRWSKVNKNTAIFFQNEKDGQLEISLSDYERILKRVYRELPNSRLLESLMELQLEPIAKQFERIAEQARALASRLGKGEVEIKSESSNLRLDSRYWAPFWSDLSHVIRNAVDHGFANPEPKQLSRGKFQPTLTLKSEVVDDRFVIEIADNGQGIDWERVSAKAAELGVPHQTKQELIDALFAFGMTTKNEVQETSGRGVGLAAVKDRVQKMHGLIELQSDKDRGTSWSFIFPRTMMKGDLWKDLESRIAS